jgi:hypothetical protein
VLDIERAKHEDTLREADRLDPDVDTSHPDYRPGGGMPAERNGADQTGTERTATEAGTTEAGTTQATPTGSTTSGSTSGGPVAADPSGRPPHEQGTEHVTDPNDPAHTRPVNEDPGAHRA